MKWSPKGKLGEMIWMDMKDYLLHRVLVGGGVPRIFLATLRQSTWETYLGQDLNFGRSLFTSH